MPDKMRRLLEDIKELSARERATLAHCLISSLDQIQDEDIDEAWAELAEKRLSELESGKVKAVAWEQIKKGIKK